MAGLNKSGNQTVNACLPIFFVSKVQVTIFVRVQRFTFKISLKIAQFKKCN